MTKNKKREYFLPPYTEGETRGQLFITIEEILWKIRTYNSCNVKIYWWGDDHNTSATQIVTIADPLTCVTRPNILKYNIKTSLTLFQLYLSTAEPIEIKFFSTKTHTLIGNAFIPVPTTLFNGSEIKTYTTGKIVSTRNNSIGSIKMKFHLRFPTPVIGNKENLKPVCDIEPIEIPTKDDISEDSLAMPKNLSSQWSHQRKSSRSFYDLGKNERATIINYLTGVRMSKNLESRALSDICSISPPESLIEAITPRPSPRKIRSPKIWLNIKLNSLSLTQTAIDKIESTTTANDAHFIFDVICYTDANGDRQNSFKFSSRILGGNFDFLIDFGKRDGQTTIGVPLHVRRIYFDVNFRNVYGKPVHHNYLGSGEFTIAGTDGKAKRQEVSVQDHKSSSILGRMVVEVQEIDGHGKKSPGNYVPRNLNKITGCSKGSNEGSTSSSTKESNESSESCGVGGGGDKKYTVNKHGKQEGNLPSKDENGEKLELSKGDPNDDRQINFFDGLIHIGDLGAIPRTENTSYFIVLHTFWRGTVCTPITSTNSFNHLDIFSLICNSEFLDRTKNNFLVLELWQKVAGSSEMLVGNIVLPLHKFYIALCDMKIAQHLKQSKLPIISTDGWTSITTPLSNEIFGQIEIILAIGTKEQIEYLKTTRNLPRTIKSSMVMSVNSVETQTMTGAQRNAEIQTSFESLGGGDTRRTDKSVKLSAFIDSLSNLRTPTSNGGPQIRKTADLLDMLNIALTQNPPIPQPNLSSTRTQTGTATEIRSTPATNAISTNPSSSSSAITTPTDNSSSRNFETVAGTEKNFFKVSIEIERALHLPKSGPRKQRGKGGHKNRGLIEIEPSTYVTFPGCGGPPETMIKSHEGPVFATGIVEKSCNPVWNKKFECSLPVEYLFANDSDEKKFEVKVLTKSHSGGVVERPSDDDLIIGTSKIDLSVLLSGLPTISGYFNIVDFAGRTNGQIKINIHPIDNLEMFKDRKNCKATFGGDGVVTDPMLSEIIDFDLPFDIMSNENSLLSRALKRKFTELEEITQRLKSRLHDVTSEGMDEDQQENDDEFEKDLNTEVEEDEDDDFSSWSSNLHQPLLESDREKYYNRQINEAASSDEMIPSTSSSSLTNDRMVVIAEALRKTVIQDEDQMQAHQN